MFRPWLLNVFILFMSLLFMAVTAEGMLRVLPVNSGLSAQDVNASSPIFRYLPDRDYTYSKGPLLKMSNSGRVNNEGFVSNLDYTPDRNSPLVAIIGDSFVEALMVPFPESLPGRLSQLLDQRAIVYSFGASGAALSQYLVWASYVRDKYHPEHLVVVVVGNDFDESLLTYKQAPGFHYFKENAEGKFDLVLVDLEASWVRKYLRRSALVRYMVLNFNIEKFVSDPIAWLGARNNPNKFAGNVEAEADYARVARSRRAVQEFLASLPVKSGLAPKHISFVIDGFRYPPQDANEESRRKASFFGLMRRDFVDQAKADGYDVVDMDDVFFPHFTANHEIFEFPYDGHWNATAHGLAADALYKSLTINGFTK